MALRVFPVDASSSPRFADAFGSHRGTDIFAPAGSPVVAVDAGSARSDTDPKGGQVVYLGAPDGTVYYYAHLQDYNGSYPRAVSAGEALGTVGTTGDAQGKDPHLHFEVHPGGASTSIDPFPLLTAVAPAGSFTPTSSSSSALPSSPGTVSFIDLPGLREREAKEPGFATALTDVAARLGLEPSLIAAVMSMESGFDPRAKNASSDAVGLIQFMPKTASALGTSSSALERMTAVQQLPFVEKFFRAKGIRSDVPGDYYLATYMPVFVGSSDNTVVATRGQPEYDQNAGLDSNGDGVITVGDVAARINAVVAAAASKPPAVFKKKSRARAPVAVRRGLWFWRWGRLLALRSSGRFDDAGELARRSATL